MKLKEPKINIKNTAMLIVGVNNGTTKAGKPLKDGSCVVIRDGRIEAAISEERVSRQKHAGGYLAAFSLLSKYLDFSTTDIDLLVTSTCCEDEKNALEDLVIFRKPYNKVKVVTCNHHLSHAYSAFYTSSFHEAVIIVIDAGGNTYGLKHNQPWWKCDREQHSYYLAKNGEIKLIGRDFFSSEEVGIGELYRAFTYYAGWPSSCYAGNTMALAGCNQELENVNRKVIFHESKGRLTTMVSNTPDHPKSLVQKVAQHACFEGYHSSSLEDPIVVKRRMARWIQAEVEVTLINLVNKLTKETGVNNICLAGGVAYNCKAMGELINKTNISNIYISPVAGDHGQALGNAIFGYNKLSNTPKKFFYTTYLGPRYDIELNKAQFLAKRLRLPLNIRLSDDIVSEAATLLKNGSILAWYQDRSEFGPRALGNRSILASPEKINIKEILNKIKGRDIYMPLAPAILEEESYKYFNKGSTKHMSVAVKSRAKDEPWFLNTIHYDGTARVQLVKREDNKIFYDLIKRFYNDTGIPVILNTSFNGRGEPIVETIADAFESFFRLDLDYLLIGNLIVSKLDKQYSLSLLIQDTLKSNVQPDALWENILQILPQTHSGKVRTRFLLYSEYVEWVRTGRKNTTIRYVKDTIDYPKDISLPLLSTGDYGQQYDQMIGRAVISKIVIKKFQELTELDAQNDGFHSLQELQTTLDTIYGKISAEEYVTIYHIDLVDTLS